MKKADYLSTMLFIVVAVLVAQFTPARVLSSRQVSAASACDACFIKVRVPTARKMPIPALKAPCRPCRPTLLHGHVEPNAASFIPLHSTLGLDSASLPALWNFPMQERGEEQR